MAKITPKKVTAFPSDVIMKEHKRASIVAEVEVAEVKKSEERKKFRRDKRRSLHFDQDGEFYVLHRRRHVAQMYVEGYPQWDIATELGIGITVVNKDLKFIREEWLQKVVENYDARKAMEIARIDRIEEEMWKAWHRSTENAETRTRSVDKALKTKYEKGTDGKLFIAGSELIPVKTINSLVQRGQSGDPRYIERIQWCIEMRCKIFGILKDEKKEVTNVVQINWENIANVSSTADSIESIIEQIENEPVMLQESQTQEE